MSKALKPAILWIGAKRFPRCVIIAFKSHYSDDLKMWSGKGWVSTFREAMLFADSDAARTELHAIQNRR